VQSVAVDIGHSLQASGARSASGQTEFSFNRRAGLLLAGMLREQGVDVAVIGEQGNIRQLTERTQLAQGRQLLLSVHHDSVQPQYLPEAGRFRAIPCLYPARTRLPKPAWPARGRSPCPCKRR
jgi:N-acetylmuramoyl-L-alanine amidase